MSTSFFSGTRNALTLPCWYTVLSEYIRICGVYSYTCRSLSMKVSFKVNIYFILKYIFLLYKVNESFSIYFLG